MLSKEGHFLWIFHTIWPKKCSNLGPFWAKKKATFWNLSGKKACQVRKLHLDNKYLKGLFCTQTFEWHPITFLPLGQAPHAKKCYFLCTLAPFKSAGKKVLFIFLSRNLSKTVKIPINRFWILWIVATLAISFLIRASAYLVKHHSRAPIVSWTRVGEGFTNGRQGLLIKRLKVSWSRMMVWVMMMRLARAASTLEVVGLARMIRSRGNLITFQFLLLHCCFLSLGRWMIQNVGTVALRERRSAWGCCCCRWCCCWCWWWGWWQFSNRRRRRLDVDDNAAALELGFKQTKRIYVLVVTCSSFNWVKPGLVLSLNTLRFKLQSVFLGLIFQSILEKKREGSWTDKTDK